MEESVASASRARDRGGDGAAARRPALRALLLAGSIAHGFEQADSDVDLLIVVDEDDYQAWLCEGRL